jgi:hypothetical protein
MAKVIVYYINLITYIYIYIYIYNIMERKLIHPFSFNIFITLLLRLFTIYYLAMITRTYSR